MGIAENIAKVRQNARSARIIAVTKNVELPQIIEAIEAGITDIGENRVQEAKRKFPALKSKYPNIKYHMIGHLQRNKVKEALELFDVIQSVDSLELAEEIDKRAQKPVDIFIEVNTSGEESKYGVAPDKAIELGEAIKKLKNLKVNGLMTIGPLTGDKEKIRSCFRQLRELREKAGVDHLSMGMSHDYPLAIEEGSDIIRIGTAIFHQEG